MYFLFIYLFFAVKVLTNIVNRTSVLGLLIGLGFVL